MGSYLVTGAAGFIGSAVAKRLIDMGHDVVTIDNLSTGKRESIPDGVGFIEGDVFDEAVIKQLESRHFDAVMHIAGQSSGEVSFEDPVHDLKTNAQSTLMLLDYAKKNNVRDFIYTSSMSVYGQPDDPFVAEDRLPTPLSFYAVGKLASEHYMRIYADDDLRCTSLRLFNVFGPGQNLSNLKQGMASIFLAMVLDDQHVIVKGALDRYRDFVYIDDVVESLIASVDRSGKPYECFNVSTGVRTTVEGVIGSIQDCLPDKKIAVECVDGTPGDQHGIYGDNSKIRAELGWAPTMLFDEGMKEMVEWAVIDSAR